jgi:hypothetical protein
MGIVLSTQPLSAQGTTTGNIRGVVQDPDGLATPGVTVVATSEALIGGRQATVTGANGVYRFPSLPPGFYSLEASLAGFQSVRQDNVVVSLGKSLEIVLQLGDLTMTDEIVVVAESTQVSTVSNSVSYNLGQQFIERQPVSRTYPNDLMNYAPGILGGQAYGAPSDSQNSYSLDGVDVSDPTTGDQWVFPSMDWVQEVEVAGLGADAEFGGFLGAQVNLITKSGGNEFRGDARLYYSGGSLNSENAPEGVEGVNTVNSDWDASLSFGGKIITDKLWFFVSGNERARAVEPFYGEGAPLDDRSDTTREYSRYLGKLTLQANESSRLLALVDYDAVYEDRRGVGDLTLASAAYIQDSPSYTYNASWEWLVNDSNFLTAKITGYDGVSDFLARNGDIPGRYDLDTGFEWQNLAEETYWDTGRTTIDLSWSLFADGLFTSKDSHNFKFGATWERLTDDEVENRLGGFTYTDDTYYGGEDGYGCYPLDDYFDDPMCALYSSDRGGEWDLHGRMQGLHAYAQDSWKVGRFAVNLGVRYSQYTGKFSGGDRDVYDVNMWAPRLGAVWDLFGDGQTALKFHYGRYYDGIAVAAFDRERSGEAFPGTEYWDWDFELEEWYPNGGSADDFADVDPNINHPYVDQFIATIEHQVAANLILGLDYINREFREISAMVTSNVGDYDALHAPDNPLTGGSLPFFELLYEPEFVITNPGDAYRDYQAVILRLAKRYSGRWALDASLTWSDLQGNADYGATSYVDEFEDLNGLVNAEGSLPGNSDWAFKLYGSVDLPWNFMLSGFYQYRTGEYWTPYVRVRGLLENDRSNVFMTPRGSEQYDNRDFLDLHLEWTADLSERMGLTLMVDVFNVFDSEKVTSVSTRWGDYRYQWDAHPEESEWRGSSSYETPLSIQTPRQIRLGAKFSF